MNVVIITGNATNNAKAQKAKESKIHYAEFGLAISHYKRETSFINIIAFGKLAEWAGKHVTKGRQYAVVGRLDGKSGRAKVVANTIEFQDFPSGAETNETAGKKALRKKAEELSK